MRYPSFPGVAKRIRERLAALGWVDPKTRTVDVGGFIKAKHYDPRSFYPWVNVTAGRTPSGKNLTRLCRDLKCSVAWLLHGEESRSPLPVVESGASSEKPTRDGSDRRGDATLRQLRRKPLARALPRSAKAAARGTGRRVA